MNLIWHWWTSFGRGAPYGKESGRARASDYCSLRVEALFFRSVRSKSISSARRSYINVCFSFSSSQEYNGIAEEDPYLCARAIRILRWLSRTCTNIKKQVTYCCARRCSHAGNNDNWHIMTLAALARMHTRYLGLARTYLFLSRSHMAPSWLNYKMCCRGESTSSLARCVVAPRDNETPYRSVLYAFCQRRRFVFF